LKPIMNYLPSYYRDIREFRELAGTEEVELQLAEDAIHQLFDDQFVITSGVEAVRRREKMLGIQADPTTETLDFRRRRIVNRYSTKPPFTLRYLQQQLDRLVGPNLSIVSVDVHNFILYLTANLEDAHIFKEVKQTVDTVKPANLIYQQNTSVHGAMGLEEHITMRSVTWNYKLGSWKLGQKPFASLGPEVSVT